MTHNEFLAHIATMQKLIRDLSNAEQDCYYNIEEQAGHAVEDAIASLKAAIDAQHSSEYYDREANYS